MMKATTRYQIMGGFLVTVLAAGIACGVGKKREGPAPSAPRQVRDGWAVTVTHLTASSSLDFTSGKRSRQLQLYLGIDVPKEQPGDPRKVVAACFVKAADEKGNALPITERTPEEILEDLIAKRADLQWGDSFYAPNAWIANLQRLPRRLKQVTLRIFIVKAVTRVNRHLDLVAMEKPLTIVPGFRFQIEQVMRKRNSFQLSFVYFTDYPNPEQKDLQTVPLLIERSLVDAVGRRIFGVEGTSGGIGDGVAQKMSGQMKLDLRNKPQPVKLRLVLATKVDLSTMDFEFHDLPVTED